MKLFCEFHPCQFTIGFGWKWKWSFWVEIPMLTVTLASREFVETIKFMGGPL